MISAILFLLSCKIGIDHVKFSNEIARLRDLREVERKGRISAQQKARDSKQFDSAENGYRYTAIGLIESAFPDRRGTPRQPLLVPSARANIRFFKKKGDIPNPNQTIITSDHFKELEQFSHVWVIFVFHNNTNSDSSKNVAKIKPPRLGGAKVGCLSTRSPHRPNNIGLSVCQISKVGKDFIELIGNDMVDGTPVLDVKPYHPSDSITLDERLQNHAIYCSSKKLLVPDWVIDEGIDIRPVHFSPESLKSLNQIHSKKQLNFCDNASHAQQLITEVLQQDIRGVHQGRGLGAKGLNNKTIDDNSDSISDINTSAPFNCRLDNMSINFVTLSDGIHVTSIEYSDNKLLSSD